MEEIKLTEMCVDSRSKPVHFGPLANSLASVFTQKANQYYRFRDYLSLGTK
jgi:hypothetical protein